MLWFIRNMSLFESWLTDPPNPQNFLSDKSNKNIFYCNIWSLILSSWNFFRDIKVKCCLVIHTNFSTTTRFMLWGEFWKASKGWGWLPREHARNKELEVSEPQCWLGRGEGQEVESIANNQWFNQSCLCNETSIETKKDRLWNASGWWTHGGVGRVGTWGECGVLLSFPHTLTHASLPFGCSWVLSF